VTRGVVISGKSPTDTYSKEDQPVSGRIAKRGRLAGASISRSVFLKLDSSGSILVLIT
jgi:hypothetical protein